MDPNVLHSTPDELECLRDLEVKIQSKTKNIGWFVNSFWLDRRVVIYLTHVCISIVVVTFCMYQLVMLEGCHSQQLYSSLLTFIIGIYLPSPSIQKKIRIK